MHCMQTLLYIGGGHFIHINAVDSETHIEMSIGSEAGPKVYNTTDRENDNRQTHFDAYIWAPWIVSVKGVYLVAHVHPSERSDAGPHINNAVCSALGQTGEVHSLVQYYLC